ncbi:MAG: 3-ketoacyl-ACP reductase [Spirochaetaceae bacterium]
MNPTALVTGAGRGIGRGIAVELAREGFSVAVNYARNAEAAEETVRRCREVAGDGQEFASFQADVGSRDAREAMLGAVYARFGELDALVNNAGIAPKERKDIIEAEEESFEELMQVNLQGPYFLTQSVARRWISGKDGSAGEPRIPSGRKIVFVSSLSAHTVSLNRGEYCISKAGLGMAAQLWAARLAGHAIQVYDLRPGITRTDMTAAVREKYDGLIAEGLVPQRRWGEPEDNGRAVAALLRGDFAFSTGAVIYTDGGFTISRL